MSLLPKEAYKKFAVITLYIAVAFAVIYLIFNYFLGALLPFIIAYILAECFRPVVRYSERNRHFPKKFFVLLVVFTAVISLGALIYALAQRLFMEINSIAKSLGDFIEKFGNDDSFAAEVIENINNMVPFGDISEKLWEIRSNLDEELWGMVMSVGDKMSGDIIGLLGDFAIFVPNAFLTTAVVIIATYYFAIDRVRINCFFLSLFPEKAVPLMKHSKDILVNTVGKYLRAYGILFAITFGELLLAFVIMGIPYSFVLALVIAMVDLLPVLGTGTVLIPWAVVSLISGNYFVGIGLLVTYAVIIVVRQVLEPKIVGKFIGLHPLATLAAIYIGLKLMGILGIFVFAIGAIIISKIIEARKEIKEECEKSQV